MNKKKTIAVAIVLALLLLIGGMLAYLTDTDTATNEFTIGDDVEISLSETWTPADGLGIHPGAKITKAPSIVNDSETTPAYVFAEIIVPCYDSNNDGAADAPLFKLLKSDDSEGTNAGWALINTPTVNTTSKTITYVYAYGTSSAMTTLAASPSTPKTTTSTPVFSKVLLEPSLTVAQKATASATPNIIVNAYGIQTDNLSSNTPSEIFDMFE